MSIPAGYFAAADLMEVLLDSTTGLPMAGGYILAYADNSRSTPKLLYQITGSPPNYSFDPLSSPLMLGAAGQPVNESGGYVTPYYYPYDADGNTQLYYLQVYNSGGVFQFALEAWPPGIPDVTPAPTQYNANNFVTNGTFLFNNGGVSSPAQGSVIAPGAHDGFVESNSDIFFEKSAGSTATDSIVFGTFSPTQIPEGDEAPEQFLRYACTNIASGETIKQITFPIAPTSRFLQGSEVTIKVWARSSTLSTLEFICTQYFGSGGSATNINVAGTFTLTNEFEVYTVTYTIPLVTGKTIGVFNDDYLNFSLALEQNSINTTDIVCFQITQGINSTPYIFQSPQTVAGQISTARTGEFKEIGASSLPGWLLLANGTIGNTNSNATVLESNFTFQLFDHIWNNYNRSWTSIYNSNGTVGTFGATSIADYADDMAISLAPSVGHAIAQANPTGASLFNTTFSGNSSTNNLLLSAYAPQLLTGRPVRVEAGPSGVLPSNLSSGTTYYVIPIDSTHIQLANTLANALARTPQTLGSAGSGTLLIFSYGDQTTVVAGSQGEEGHTEIEAELAGHNHPGSSISPAISFVATITTPFETTTGAGLTNTPQTLTIADDGSNQAFNVIQPTTYMNRFIKL